MPLISLDDYVQEPATVLSSPGYTFVPTLPITNLKTARLGVKARVATGNGVLLRADFAGSRPTRMVSLLNANVANVPFASAQARIYNAGFLVGTQNLAIEWPNPLTKQFPQHLHFVFPQTVPADRVEVTVTGQLWGPSGALQAGGFEAGRLWASDAWVFDGVKEGFKSDWSPRIFDDGSTIVSLGGAKYHQRRRRRRGLDLSFKNFSTLMTIGGPGEAIGLGLYYAPNILDVFHHLGTTKDFIVLPRDSLLERHKIGLYCSIIDMSGPTHRPGELFDFSFRATESF